MARTRPGTRVAGWAAAATLLAATPLMAACSGGSDSSSASPKGSPSSSSGTSDGSGGSAGNDSAAPSDRQATVSSVVSAWVSAVIEKDTKQVCLLSTKPGSDSAPKANSPQTCNASMTKKMDRGIKSLSKSFTPKNSSGKPKVKVDAPTPKGNKAAVPAEKITVDGQPLKTIMLSGSKGVNSESFNAKVTTDKIDGKWYVNDFDMGIGKGQ